MVGTASRPEWLQTDWVLSHFNQARGKAVKGYVDFVRAGVGLPSLWESLQGQIFLGSQSFVDRMQQLAAERGELTEISLRHCKSGSKASRTKHNA